MGATRPVRAARRMLALGLLFVMGCGGGASPTPTGAPAAPDSPSPSAASTPDGPSASPDNFDLVMSVAAGTTDPGDSDLGELWAEVFRLIEIDGAARYTAPAEVRSYQAGEVPPTTCTANSSARRYRNNALYCPDDHVIAYDEDWFRDMGERFSFFAPVSVLAHEWGHHVQSVVGWTEYDIQLELQADCFSGLYLTANGFLPHGTDDFENEHLAMEVALRTWFDQGDDFYPDSEWRDAGLHGSAVQRMMAVSTGLLSNLDYLDPDPSLTLGLPWCLGYEGFEGSDYVEVGPYAFLQVPGREGAWSGDVFGIPADTRTSLETSDIALAWIPDLPLDGPASAAQMQALWELAYPGIAGTQELEIEANAPEDVAVAYYYDNDATMADGSIHEESGIMALLSPAGGEGGLFIVVSRGEPAPVETSPAAFAQLEEQVVTLFQVLNRLCSPGESADVGAQNGDVVCLRDLQ